MYSMAQIKSTMRTTVKGLLEIKDDGQVFVETENGRYTFADIFTKFNGEEVDIAMVLKEDEE